MTGPSRDRAIERLLAVPAGRPSGDAVGPCVDAEAVAAWLDGGLAAPAAAQLETHVAACGSCQELLAAVVRMMPAEVPALQPVPRRPWTAWALPLAAAAVLVLAVWTTWPGSSGPGTPPVLKEESRMARAETPAPATAAPESPVAAPPEAARTQPPARSPASAPAALGRAERQAGAPIPPARSASPADSSEREAAPPVAQTRQFAKAEARAEDKATVAEAETAAPRADAPAQPAESEARARPAGNVSALAGATQGLRDAAGARVTVQAPGARWRWRADRVVEFSSDGGATWRQAAGTTAAQAADLLAGASPAPQTVWLVGRRGLVLVASDGVRFDPRPPPAPLDLVAVQATDQLTAIVRAATGEAWRTVDGGRTWAALAR